MTDLAWNDASRILVTGGTGMQGGAVARAAVAAGLEVAALVRKPDSPPARALVQLGVELVVGDLDDSASLEAACAGCAAVFSVQLAPGRDRDSERRQARHLVEAASKAGVRHLVHSSVSGTGWRARHPDVKAGVMGNYWDSKEEVEVMVRGAGFDAYTILRPGFVMENFVAPKVDGMFPHLRDREIVVATDPGTLLALVAAADIGAATVAAVTDRRRFAGAEIELAGDVLTFPEIAEVVAKVTERPVSASCLSVREVDARLGSKSWSASQAWLGPVGYPARPEHAAEYGLGTVTFSQWAGRHQDELRAATAPAA